MLLVDVSDAKQAFRREHALTAVPSYASHREGPNKHTNNNRSASVQWECREGRLPKLPKVYGRICIRNGFESYTVSHPVVYYVVVITAYSINIF